MKAIQKSEPRDGRRAGRKRSAEDRRGENAERGERESGGTAEAEMMSPMSAEATVVRHIDWMAQVPWNARSKVKKTRVRRRKSSIPTIMVWSAKDRILSISRFKAA